MRAGDGGCGVLRMMQGLAEHRDVNTVGGDGWMFEITEAKLEIFQAVPPGLLCAEADHLFGIVDGDYFLRATRQQLADQTFARTEISNFHRVNDAQEEVAKRLPG